MSAYDQDRYVSLLSRASFAMNAYTGSFQDQSRNRLAMTAVGTPTWTMVSGLPALMQNAADQGATSGAVTPIVDITGTVSFEIVANPRLRAAGYNPVMSQTSGAAAAGFIVQDYQTQAAMMLVCVNGGGLARGIHCPTDSNKLHKYTHTIITSVAGATSGYSWINGVPAAVTLLWAGAAVNVVNANVAVGGAPMGWSATSGRWDTLIIRAYPFALTSSDVSALYGAAKSLTGGEV